MSKMSQSRKVRRGVVQPSAGQPVPKFHCGNCKFADITNIAEPFCRRFPAQLVKTDVGVRALYPVVTVARDWCGEHQPRPDDNPQD